MLGKTFNLVKLSLLITAKTTSAIIIINAYQPQLRKLVQMGKGFVAKFIALQILRYSRCVLH